MFLVTTIRRSWARKSGPMDELLTRRENLEKEIRRCAAYAKAETKKTAATLRKASNFADGRPSALHQKYLLIFMMVAGGDAEAALSMLRREHRLRLPWQDWDTEQQRLHLEDFVLSFAWPDLLDKIEHLRATEAGFVSRARTLLAETRAAKWARTMNRQQALTPTPREVVHFCGARAPLEEWLDLRTPGAQR